MGFGVANSMATIFNYPNFLAFLNSGISEVGQKGSDNQGWTVLDS